MRNAVHCQEGQLMLLSSQVIIDLTQDHRLYLVDTLVAIHLSQLVLLFVVADYLVRFIEEVDQPSSHCLSCIIRTLIELTSVQITHTSHYGWVKLDMVDVCICSTEYSARQPPEYLSMRNL